MNIFTVKCWKDKNKENEVREWPILKIALELVQRGRFHDLSPDQNGCGCGSVGYAATSEQEVCSSNLTIGKNVIQNMFYC